MKKLWILLSIIGVYFILTAKLHGSPIISSPDLTVACDGYLNDAHCITGTIVYFVNGYPQIHLLESSWYVPEPIIPVEPTLPTIDIPPTLPTPVVSTAPEPRFFWPIVISLALVVVFSAYPRRS